MKCCENFRWGNGRVRHYFDPLTVTTNNSNSAAEISEQVTVLTPWGALKGFAPRGSSLQSGSSLHFG